MDGDSCMKYDMREGKVDEGKLVFMCSHHEQRASEAAVHRRGQGKVRYLLPRSSGTRNLIFGAKV